jgi:hypothetical protein
MKIYQGSDVVFNHDLTIGEQCYRESTHARAPVHVVTTFFVKTGPNPEHILALSKTVKPYDEVTFKPSVLGITSSNPVVVKFSANEGDAPLFVNANSKVVVSCTIENPTKW